MLDENELCKTLEAKIRETNNELHLAQMIYFVGDCLGIREKNKSYLVKVIKDRIAYISMPALQ